MLMVRDVFHAKYGRGDELVALFQEMSTRMKEDRTLPRPSNVRLFTDASGPFFTIVSEMEMENFAAFEKWFHEGMSQPWMGEWFSRMMPLVDSGRREFYNVVNLA